MDRRQASSSSQLTARTHYRRIRPKASLGQNKTIQQNTTIATSNVNNQSTSDQSDRDLSRQQRLALKNSILNGLDKNLYDSTDDSPGPAQERTYSSRNIIASNFMQNQKSNQPEELPQKMPSPEKSSEDEDPRYPGNPLSYGTVIDNRDIASHITPFLIEFGLDDVRNYTQLRSDRFFRAIDGIPYCILCCQKIEREESLYDHMAYPKHVDRFLKLRSKLLNLTPNPQSINMVALQHLMNLWKKSSSLTKKMTAAREAAMADINAIIAEVEPRCQCRPIGSFAIGVSLNDSDINLELLHPNNKLFISDPRAKNSIHHKLVDPKANYGFQINNHTMHYDMISNAVETLYKVALIIDRRLASVKTFKLENKDFCQDLNAKVPKLVLYYKPQKVRLEIWCYAEYSYQLACLLRNYISLDARASDLCILVKKWARLCRISNPRLGTFTPETFIILVIHFLQRVQPPVLPCLHDLFGRNNEKSKKNRSKAKGQQTVELDKKAAEDSDETDAPAGPSSKRADSENNTDTTGDDDDETEEESSSSSSSSEEEELLDQDFDQKTIDSLGWKSQNQDPVHKLFVDFLKFSMGEFANPNQVISIRTLKRLNIRDKKWTTQVKPIENPVRPSINLSKNIASLRTYDYIRKCFSNGYYYLTSIPMTQGLKRLKKPRPDPTNYIQLYFNLELFDSYYRDNSQRIRSNKGQDLIDDMIDYGLFARDVEVVKELVEYSIVNDKNLESIPSAVATNYDDGLLLPPDSACTIYCWLCKNFGHTRESCPRGLIRTIKESEIDPTIDRSVNFDAGFIELYVNDMIKLEMSTRHNELVEELREAIQKGTKLPCILELFGSTVNLLGSVDSDLDICMTLEGNPSGRGIDCVKILRKVSKVLYKNSLVRNQSIEPILSARVPIIKFKYDNFHIDLSMYNQCAIHNSKLLRTYVTIDPRVGQLCYLVKQYAKSCGIADASKGSLSSYAWSLMVIHYLQHTKPAILPVLQETTSLRNKPVIGVNGWNVWFNEDFKQMPVLNDTCLTTLFKEFLLYYMNFDFNQYVISIRTSRLITKFQKSWTCCMMAIEDPFELTYNLSGRLDDSMAIYIMNSFPRAFKYIDDFQKGLRRRGQTPKPEILKLIFNGRAIMGCEPPFRGCRHCHRIGHRIKDCPEKKPPKRRTYPERNGEPNPGQATKEERRDMREEKQKPRHPRYGRTAPVAKP